MIRKIYFSLVALICLGFSAMAQDQNGAIKVTLIDKATKETIPFANIVAYQGGVQVGVATTNMDGECVIKPLRPGKYNVKGVYVGYQASEVRDIVVGEGKTAYVTIALSNDGGVKLDEVEVVTYQVPLIDPDTKVGQTVTREEYQNLASKDVNSVAATTGGVYQSDEGGGISVRGGRGGSATYFVDGIKIIGSLNLPQQSIGSLEVITGGVPASYGDLTSGVISVSTRGPQSKFFGGVELISSQLTDAYGYNSLGFSFGGPMINKKDSSGNKRTVLGFFLSGQGTYEKEPDPSFLPIYVLKDDKLNEIKATPLLRSPSGTGYVRSSEYVTMEDMKKQKTRSNASSRAISLNGKFDFAPTLNTNITLGGFFEYSGGFNAGWAGQVFNAQNNSFSTNTTIRPYLALTQKFGSGTSKEKSQSLITNPFFKLNVSYESSTNRTEDIRHRRDYFKYGYVGKFSQDLLERDFAFNYSYNPNFVVNGDSVIAYTYNSPSYGPMSFQASDINPDAALYTSFLFNDNPNGIFFLNQVVGNNALRNGDVPQSIYGLYNNFGTYPSSAASTYFNQFRFAASFNADIKNHAVTVGMEFDQRFLDYYNVFGAGLWTRMRQITNSHLEELDFSNPILVPEFSGSIPYYYFNNLYQADKQTVFSQNLLAKLGYAKDYNRWINIDELDPSTFSMDMFSAEDLIDKSTGNQFVFYGGYDHTGKKVGGETDISDFLNKKDQYGKNLFPIGTFKPIYSSIFVMDKFDFKDIKINAGLRIDRYDANQKVLKDEYAVHDLARVGDLASIQGLPANFTENIPQNISKDAAVYVSSDPSNGSSYTIKGFREGNKWFDAQGNEVSDPNLIASADGRPIPLFKDLSNYGEKMSADAFKDYVAAINVMPRIAFSFPISDVANFFAHYDILTQRPGNTVNRLNPFDYYFLGDQSGNPFLTNPNLKPQQTIDYELGFSQILSERKNASLTITSFYREMRNMLQQRAVIGAYPRNYLMYDNLDFGTVKGLTATFDFRRTGGSSIKANYTLQFAEGSGSNANSGGNLASTGQPNLRILQPLDFDQRHTITLTYDYRFGSQKDYKGPQLKRKSGKTLNIFEDVGFNFTFFIGSGTPYTRWSTPVALNGGARSNILGSVNGSRLPWNIRGNLRVDKNIPLTWGKKEGDEKKHEANLNIYLQVLNVLNNRNVLSVYNFTGNPDDDGYLQSSQAVAALAQANSPQSFRDLYTLRMQNPDRFNKPRVIRVGLLLEF